MVVWSCRKKGFLTGNRRRRQSSLDNSLNAGSCASTIGEETCELVVLRLGESLYKDDGCGLLPNGIKGAASAGSVETLQTLAMLLLKAKPAVQDKSFLRRVDPKVLVHSRSCLSFSSFSFGSVDASQSLVVVSTRVKIAFHDRSCCGW